MKSHGINKQTYSGRHCDGFRNSTTHTVFQNKPSSVIGRFEIVRSSSEFWEERWDIE
jgi:hypothetical protein